MASNFNVVAARNAAASVSGSVNYTSTDKVSYREGFVAGAYWEYQSLQQPDMDAAVLQMSVALRVFAKIPTNTAAIAAINAYDAAVLKYSVT